MLKTLILLSAIHSGLAVPTFDFHSNFWINLHHSLFRAAQAPGPPQRMPVAAPIGTLSADEQRDWNAAVQYYRDHMIQRDLLFDDGMDAIKRGLAASEADSQVTAARIPAELAAVLNRVAPVYRVHWWPRHDAANRLWIASVQTLMTRVGDRLAEQLSVAYATQWHTEPIRVDVTPWAGPRLVAYTNGTDHGHIVVSSTDPCDQGLASLETLYHEASHTIVGPGLGAVGSTISATATRLHGTPPDGLWHAVMFFTQGDLLRRDLAEIGVGYEPGAGICNQFTGSWAIYRDALELFWKPYLEGRSSLDSATTNVLRSLTP